MSESLRTISFVRFGVEEPLSSSMDFSIRSMSVLDVFSRKLVQYFPPIFEHSLNSMFLQLNKIFRLYKQKEVK